MVAGTSHDGKTYELAGDHAYTLLDFAAEISRQTGRTIPYKNLPAHDMRRRLWDSVCPRRSQKPSPVGMPTRRTGRCSTTAASSGPDRPTHDTALDRSRRQALAAVSKS